MEMVCIPCVLIGPFFSFLRLHSFPNFPPSLRVCQRQRTALNEDDKLSTTEGLSLIRDTVVEEVATQQHNIFRWIYWLATCIGSVFRSLSDRAPRPLC